MKLGGVMPREGVLGQATRIDPVPADHEALDSLRAREDLGGGELVLRTGDGTEISLPSSLLRLVVSAASNLAAGRAVMTIPAEVMLTPAEAAELLGLSRPLWPGSSNAATSRPNSCPRAGTGGSSWKMCSPSKIAGSVHPKDGAESPT
jgi:hypothetical protein